MANLNGESYFVMEELDRLLEKYAIAAKKHGEATEAGDSKNANKHFRYLNEIYKELMSSKENAALHLTKFLEHPDGYVRLWAASHTLSIDSKKASKILSELAKKPGFLGLTAETTLEEWKKGNL